MALGLRPGFHAAILAESRPEWGAAFFGTQLAGGTLIPLDAKATFAESHALAEDCKPSLIFASPSCLDAARQLASRCGAEYGVIDLESARALSDTADSFPDKRLSDTALIVYTSGTTGAAKGVMISVSTLLFQMESLVAGFGIREDDRFLSILPLSHSLELTCGMLGVIQGGAQTWYCTSIFPADVTYALRMRRATHMIAVPYFLRLLARQIRAAAAEKPGPRRRLFSLWLRLAPALPGFLRRGLFRPVHEALGGRMRGFISGGAPLDADTEDFLSRLGLRVYQGYGLTETGPVISANRPGLRRPGSVGKPLPGVEIRFRPLDGGEDDLEAAARKSGSAESGTEGEILTRGPHVMQGYLGRPDLTDGVLDAEGWLHTGDTGYQDKDGFLRITGRIKSLIVLEGGKKVHPEEVEHALSSLPSVKEACVLARAEAGGKEELLAVVVPQNGSPAEAGGGSEETMRREITIAMAAFSAYKRPARIVFLARELPRTASRKIRREAVKALLQGDADASSAAAAAAPEAPSERRG